MRPVVVLAALAVVVGVSGCGGDDYSSYSGSKACGVPAATVTDVVGTDEYKTVTKGEALPPTGVRSYSCSVNLADRKNALTVSAKRASFNDIDNRKRQIAASDEKFPVAGGQAGIDVHGQDFTALWVCDTKDPDGTITASVSAGDTQASAQQRRALVTTVAEEAGTACG
jgi:hypothetical protein